MCPAVPTMTDFIWLASYRNRAVRRLCHAVDVDFVDPDSIDPDSNSALSCRVPRVRPTRSLLCLVLLGGLALAQVDDSHRAEFRQELSQADTALRERDYEAAKNHYTRASELAHERSVDALRGLAWANLRLDDPQSALLHAQAALALATHDPERGEIHNLMGAIQYAEYQSNTARTDKLR